MIIVSMWRDWIAKEVVRKFGCLKIDNCENAVMCSDDDDDML